MKKLIEAIKQDSLVGVRKMLESDSTLDLNEAVVLCDEYDIDEPDEIPLLFWVVSSGVSLEMIELLIKSGMDILQVNRDGLGAIDIAIKHNRLDIIELCGKHGISYTHTHRRSGMTPLMAAASFGNKELVDFFLKHGASAFDTDKRDTDAIEYARILGHEKIAEYLRESQKEKQGK